jgi:hypothetical protein
MKIVEVPCICTSEFCEHTPGQKCGKEVKVRLKVAVALGESKFTPEIETGVCEDCWKSIVEAYPQLFSK